MWSVGCSAQGPLEPTVTATGKPDALQSALANLRDQSIPTECLAREPVEFGNAAD